MFCTLADVRIRERTSGKRGLIDALRGILDSSGGIEAEWPLTKALTAGDEATGVPVLEQLYEQMKSSPMDPDLAKLWTRLGVEAKGDSVELIDTAPDAGIRRSISAAPSDAPEDCMTKRAPESASREIRLPEENGLVDSNNEKTQ